MGDARITISPENFGYDKLPPIGRANFLDWIATGKNDPSYDQGYLYLYLLGLEYALLIDETEEQEKNAIFQELNDLYKIYYDCQHSSVFTNIFQFVLWRQTQCIPFDPNKTFRAMDRMELFSIEGGIHCLNKNPLTAMHAYANLRQIKSEELKNYRLLCPYVYQKFFEAKFNEMYPNGVKISPPSKILKNSYQSITEDYTLDDAVYYNECKVPDITESTKLSEYAVDVSNIVTKELEPYIILINKNKNHMIDKKYIEYVPKSNEPEIFVKIDTIVQNWAESMINKSDGITINDIAFFTNFEFHPNYEPDHWFNVLIALERVGYGVVPDLGFEIFKAYAPTPAAIFKLKSTPEDRTKSSGKYQTALSAMIIGFELFRSKQPYTKKQLALILKHRDNFTHLSAYELEMLLANYEIMQKIQIESDHFKRVLDIDLKRDFKYLRNAIIQYVEFDKSLLSTNMLTILICYEILFFGYKKILKDFKLNEQQRTTLFELVEHFGIK